MALAPQNRVHCARDRRTIHAGPPPSTRPSVSYAGPGNERYHRHPVPVSAPPWTAALAALLVAGGACQRLAPNADDYDPNEPCTMERSEKDGAKGASPPQTTKPDASGPAPAKAADRTAELKDLGAMCAALDHDYIDGTLSDYYAEVKPATAWGERVKKAGDAADQPGRHLEGEAKSLTETAGLELPEACTELFDVLDDLE